MGLYAQDQWRANENLTLTFGLRADMPVFFDQPTYDPQVTTDFGPDLDVPSGKVLLAPRVGFNLNLPGQSDRQLRGGVGLFTGTPAYVWMSNAFANNGTGLVILGCGTGFGDVGPAPAFNPSATSPTIQCDNGVGIDPNSTFLGEVDIVGKDTKYPRVLRANLAFDTRLPEDIVATVEGILTKGINDYFIVNRNLPAPVGTDAAGRTMYGTIQPNDGRPSTSYFNSSVYGTGSGGVYELRNTSKNYSWNATAQLRKAFGQALRASASYTYSQSKDVASFTSSRAISNWRFGRVTSGEDLVDTRETSSFDRPHRIVLSGTYRFPWQNFGTELSLTYIGQSGQPYTLIAGGSSGRGDLNADGTNGNDPIYIPTGVSDPLIQFADPTQAAAFDTFISGESCLAEQRGSIMQRNSCRNPWQNFLDMSLRQELPYGANRLTLEISLFNVLNLLDSDWGQVKSAGGGEFYTQTILNLDTADASGNPIFSFNEPSERFTSNGRPINSWQLQFSARYNYR
ncbi:MAG: TonB-dependent receptor [Acidimicrobiia bacterium]|nr:TonB-dependent receptor [Acidimicrobiia bacterium]